jgi:hypothetical protein
MKLKKLVSILLVIVMVTVMIPPVTRSDAAVVVGTTGTISSSSVPNLNSGVSFATMWNVGLVQDTLKTSLTANDSAAVITSKIVENYSNKVPNTSSSIFFLMDDAANDPYKFKADSALGWYNASTGEIVFAKDDKYEKTVRPIRSGWASSNYFIYNEIESETLSELSKGGWKTHLSGKTDAQVQALWSWLLQNDGSLLNTRLNTYLKTTGTRDQKIKAYVDLLASLYFLFPEGVNKQAFDSEIERYLVSSSDLSSNPVRLMVAPAVRVIVNSPSLPSMYMKAWDFVAFQSGVTASASFIRPKDGKNYVTSGGTKALISDSINMSLSEQPNRSKPSSLPPGAWNGHWSNAGIGAVGIGELIFTRNNTLTFGSSASTGFLNRLTFSGQLKGFNIITSEIWRPELPTELSTKFEVKVEDPKVVNLQEPVTGGKIGQDVKGQIRLTTTTEEYDKWRTSTNLDSAQISVKVTRTSPNASATLNSSYNLTGTYQAISKTALLDLVSSKKVIEFTDTSVTNYTINNNQSLKFEYSVEVKIKPTTGAELILQGNPDKDSKTFNRGAVIPPASEIGTFTSNIVAGPYSEIKEGTIGNETFEAMAGVPTSQTLHFTSGSSEFLVEVEVERVADFEQSRRYTANYTGNPNPQFKAGDTAGTYSVGGYSVNAHTGGSFTKTWSGSIPNTATAVTVSGSGNVTATCPAQPDRSAYNAAMAEAQAYATQVNGTVISHTAASDGQTRTFSGWGASASGSPSDPQTTSASASNWIPQPYVPASGTPGEPGYTAGYQPPPLPGPVTVTANPGGAGSYTITVTFSCPADAVCGPTCRNTLPAVQDTWIQKSTFDYLKINVARIWKLDQAAVGGMTEVTGTDLVKATVTQGDPTWFYNRSISNNSATNRLRYTLETDQHDNVVWNLGMRTNKETGNTTNLRGATLPRSHVNATGILYSNSSFSNVKDNHKAVSDAKDKSTTEFLEFDRLRNLMNEVTVISDMLILQTSSGDEAIIYFEKAAPGPKPTQENFAKVSATFAEMWTNNPTAAPNHVTSEAIAHGGYTGSFATPTSKHTPRVQNKTVVTKFDTMPAGFNRTARPSAAFRLVTNGIRIIDSLTNGPKSFGQSSVFYRNVLNFGPGTPKYSVANVTKFGAAGYEVNSTYSPSHSMINDILIHNPVSTEDTFVVPLQASRDQRTVGSVVGGDLTGSLFETIRQLKNPLPKQNLVWNGNAETLDATSNIAGWRRVGNATFSVETGATKIAGLRSFNVGGAQAGYYAFPEVTSIVGDVYSLTAKVASYSSGIGTVQLVFYDAAGNVVLSRVSANHTSSTSTSVSVNGTAPSGAVTLEVRLNKTSSAGNVIFDDVVLYNNSKTEWQPVKYTIQEEREIDNPDYMAPTTMPNPSYIAPIVGGTQTYNFTGGVQTFTIPMTGQYVLEAWGAQGGGSPNEPNAGGLGGYAKSVVNLTMGQALYIYAGGKGGNSPSNNIDQSTSQNSNGGWNGGGHGSGSRGPGGGGRSDVRTSTSVTAELVVGAGGGASATSSWQSIGSTANSNSIRFQGSNGVAGHTGSYPKDNGGGGGGYFGGHGMDGDDQSYGYAGTNYAIGTGSTNSYGVNSGNGYVKITSPSQAGQGSPTIQVNNKAYKTAYDAHVAGGSTASTFTTTLEPWLDPAPPQKIKTGSSKVYTITDAPDDWYETVVIELPAVAPVEIPGTGTFTPGNFINLSYGFQIFFPSTGNFYGDGAWGVGTLRELRGKGYTNGMDTSPYIARKIVMFEFDVIYNGVVRRAMSEIDLDVNNASGIYNFYLPMSNSEAVSAAVHFYAIASNGYGAMDNDLPTNKQRYPLTARHSSSKITNIDIVGRIGNLLIEDTGDYRFANLFKQVKVPLEWLVPGLVRDVDLSRQNKIAGDLTDIRGVSVTPVNRYLNTFGQVAGHNVEVIKLPLTPAYNNITAFIRQPIRIGYKAYMGVQTIGNYQNGRVQIIPKYYILNLTTGVIQQADVYMTVDGSYLPINLFDNVQTGWDPNSVYSNAVRLDWENEAIRRNYSNVEKTLTERMSGVFQLPADDGSIVNLPIPTGKYHTFGTNQLLMLNNRNRTFVGSSMVNNQYNENPGDVINSDLFGYAAQRWHYTEGLPSSAVVVARGAQPTQANIDAVRESNSVILVSQNIKAQGNMYTLQYYGSTVNSTVTIAGNNYNISSIPDPIVIISSVKSAEEDLDIRGSH